ncbi:MAG: SH3 domain-containing protein [Chloroflexaceae bacterium]|nr:SH3 domain-containing protein [Chloroflexaceae bacterium]
MPTPTLGLPLNPLHGSASTQLTVTVQVTTTMQHNPSPHTRVLHSLPAGTVVTLQTRTSDGTWYSVTNPDGQNGWVPASVLPDDMPTTWHVPVAQPQP